MSGSDASKAGQDHVRLQGHRKTYEAIQSQEPDGHAHRPQARPTKRTQHAVQGEACAGTSDGFVDCMQTLRTFDNNDLQKAIRRRFIISATTVCCPEGCGSTHKTTPAGKVFPRLGQITLALF